MCCTISVQNKIYHENDCFLRMIRAGIQCKQEILYEGKLNSPKTKFRQTFGESNER